MILNDEDVQQLLLSGHSVVELDDDEGIPCGDDNPPGQELVDHGGIGVHHHNGISTLQGGSSEGGCTTGGLVVLGVAEEVVGDTSGGE